MLFAHFQNRLHMGAFAFLLFLVCYGRPPSADAQTTETAPLSADFTAENQASLLGDKKFDSDPADPDARAFTSLWENLSFFGGLDGSKQPEDLGINAHLGMRGAVNWGVPLLEKYGVGLQVGTALNYSANAVRVLKSIDGTHETLQNFTTIGVFQRADVGINWGVAYDFRFDDYYQNLSFGQWRGQIGYNVAASDEVGVKGMVSDHGQDASVGGQSFHLASITQGDLFWRHIWENDITTCFWVGLAESHGRFLFVSPGDTPAHTPIVFGAEIFVPLTERLAIFGEANFITPNDTGTVDATLGIAFFPGAGARRTARSRFAPLLPLGNNASFAVDLRQ